MASKQKRKTNNTSRVRSFHKLIFKPCIKEVNLIGRELLDNSLLELYILDLTQKTKEENIPLDFMMCERTNNCVYDQKYRTHDCSKTIAETIDPDTLKAMRLYFRENKGMHIFPGEYWLIYFNEIDPEIRVIIEGEREKTSHSWKRISNRCKIEFLEFPYQAEKQFHKRASAQQKNTCERLFSHINKNSLPITIEENMPAKIGTAAHKLQNHQPGENFIHNEIAEAIGMKKTNRNKYAEQNLEYSFEYEEKEYTSRGSPDGTYQIIDPFGNLEGMLILDFKNAQFSVSEKPTFKRQMLTYGLALAQLTNTNPEYFILVSVRSPFGSIPLANRSQKPIITKVPNHDGNTLIQEVKEDVIKYIAEVRSTFYNLKKAQDLKQKLEDKTKDGCTSKYNPTTEQYDAECFSKKMCDFIMQQASEQDISPAELIKKEDWFVKDYTI